METVFSCQLSKMSKEIKFRQLTLADEIKIQERFPNYSESITTTKVDMAMLSEILYMVIKNKELFKPETRQVINDKGEKANEKVGGLELFRSCVVTEGDQSALLCAFIEVCKKSRPEMDEVVKKKRTLRRLTFSLSLILLALATGGLITKLCL